MNKKSQIRLVKRSSCGIPPNSYIANPSKKICQNSTNENQPSNINQSLQTSRLFDLPQVIFHLIFGHYLKLHELVQFDIAVCNHSDRRKYLLLVENITFKSLESIKNNVRHLEWIHSRKVRLERVAMPGNIGGSYILKKRDISGIIGRDHILEMFPLHWESIKEIVFPEDGYMLSADVALECLLKCTSLEELSLGAGLKLFGIDGEYADTLLQVFDHQELCARLRKVALRHYYYSTDNAILSISKHCRNLTAIGFDPGNIDVAVMTQFYSSCGPKLESFNWLAVITYDRHCCPEIIQIGEHSREPLDETMISLTLVSKYFSRWSFPKLTNFYFTGSAMSDKALLAIVQKSPYLKSIKLTGSPYISDAGMYHIASHCCNLEELVLDDLPGITQSEYLIDILISNPRLRKSGFTFQLAKSDYNGSYTDGCTETKKLPRLILLDESTRWESHYTSELAAVLNSRL